MRRRLRHTLLAVVVLGALASTGGAATAQDADCARALWAVPIETLELPEGWTWSSLTALPDGGWSGSIETPKPDSEVASGFDDATDDIYFAVECTPDPGAFIEARSRARDMWPDAYRDISTIEVGDSSLALQSSDGSTGLDWANGTVYGTIHANDDADWSAVEDFALALDALLP
jgi:hypothetical protein